MSAAPETIGVGRLAWLLAAMAAASLPFTTTLPPWEPLGMVALAWWRLRGERRGQPVVGMRVRLVLLVGAVAGLVASDAIGFGLSAATPAFVAFLWIKLLEVRSQRDYLLACSLCYFLVAVLLFDQQSLLTCAYAIAAVGIITGALAGFHAGRQAGPTLRLVAVLVAQGLPLAAAAFMLIPRLQLPLPNLGGQGISGFADHMRPGDIARVATSDRVAFRVEFPDGQLPRPEDLYWRGLVMNESSDGAAWRVYRSASAIPLAATKDDIARPLVVQDITLMPNNRVWLFALDTPAVLPENARLQANSTVTYVSEVNHVLRYTIASRLGREANDEDVVSGRGFSSMDPRVTALAAQLGADRPGADQAAERVLDYFRDHGFTYSLSPGQMGDDAVGAFLFERRSGFCAHYATAFATLMRLMRFKARVVVGYRGGEINPYGGFLVVRQEHAHAWAEVREPDGRWRRFDPTLGIPIAAGESIPAAQQAAAAALGQTADRIPGWVPGWLRNPYHSTSQWWQFAEARWDSWFMSYDAEHQTGLLAWLGLGRLGPLGLCVALVAVGSAVLALLAALMRRQRKRRLDPAGDSYLRFCARLAAAGVARRSWEGPVDFTTRAAAALPVHAALLREMGWRYARLRYGPAADPRAVRTELAALRSCAQRLSAHAPPAAAR